MSEYNLSVVIITRNRLSKLKRCIDSLSESLLKSGSEIIVIDNGSSDGSSEYIKNLENIKFRLLKDNVGVAKARNIGISLATRDFLMFIDDDAWISAIDFQKIEKYFFDNPDVGMIVPKLLYPDGNIQESIRSFPTILAIFWRGFGLYKLFPKVAFYKRYLKNNVRDLEEIDWAIGACQIIRKSVFDKIGLLDEGYFFGYEDVDLCFRMQNNNLKRVFWSQAIIYHEYSRISSRGFNIYLIRHIASICRFFMKKLI